MKRDLIELFDSNLLSKKSISSTPLQSLSEITAGSNVDDSGLSASLNRANRVAPRIDYSDFSNFVFYNSALDYFNSSANRIINEYPFDGTSNDSLIFEAESDGYQLYVLDSFPRRSGSAIFASGNVASVAVQTGKMQLSGSEFTYEFWVDMSSLPSMSLGNSTYVMQMLDNSGSNVLSVAFKKYLTGVRLITSVSQSYVSSTIIDHTGTAYFALTSNASSSTIYQSLTRGVNVRDQNLQAISVTTNPSTLLIGSGSATSIGLSGSTQQQPGIKIRELRIWNVVKTIDELQANYNVRVHNSDDLLYYARCTDGFGRRLLDYSGNKIHCNISSGSWSTFSFGINQQDISDIIINRQDPLLSSFIDNNTTIATSFDRLNKNSILKLVPSQMLIDDEEVGNNVLKNMLHVYAKQFDELKLYIDNIPNLLKSTYSSIGGAPDAIMYDTLKFWGWDPNSSFVSFDMMKFFFGRGVLSDDQSEYDNARLDVKITDIKQEFWRRMLQNLMYVYKRKGTKESVESLLRVYGLDEKTVKLKELGTIPEAGISTRRINSEKSATALRVQGKYAVETSGSPVQYTGEECISMQIKFPQPGNYSMPPTLDRGAIFHVLQSSGSSGLASTLAFPLGHFGSGTIIASEMRYIRDISSTTGSLMFLTYNGVTTASCYWSNVPIFDGQWHNIFLHREIDSGQARVTFRSLLLDESDVMETYPSSTGSGLLAITEPFGSHFFSIGAHELSSPVWQSTSGSEFWVRNVQVWPVMLSETEMIDHTLNPFSHGTDTLAKLSEMSLNWEFDEDRDTIAGHAADSSILWKSLDKNYLGGEFYYNGIPTTGSYDRDVFEYNFIATPEYGWNEDKIRILDGSKVPEFDDWNDKSTVVLEFNFIDALNEDIGLMMTSLDEFSQALGDPASRFRDSYQELSALRNQYFRRLSDRLNFRAFADFLDFYDKSFVTIVNKLLPARARFLGAEFVVESHMLERPKAQQTYRRPDPVLVPEGGIVIYSAFAPIGKKYAPPGKLVLSTAPRQTYDAFRLMWMFGPYLGGWVDTPQNESNVTTYVVLLGTDNNVNNADVVAVVPSTTSSFEFSGLEGDTTYYSWVRADNAWGSTLTGPTIYRTPAAPPLPASYDFNFTLTGSLINGLDVSQQSRVQVADFNSQYVRDLYFSDASGAIYTGTPPNLASDNFTMNFILKLEPTGSNYDYPNEIPIFYIGSDDGLSSLYSITYSENISGEGTITIIDNGLFPQTMYVGTTLTNKYTQLTVKRSASWDPEVIENSNASTTVYIDGLQTIGYVGGGGGA